MILKPMLPKNRRLVLVREIITNSPLGEDELGLRGVVLETYGAGNAMTYDWFLNALHNAVKRGIIIMNVSQCLGGSVEMGIYETGNQLSKAGVIGAMDMTTEATVVKLMFLLGQGYSQSEIEKLMLQNISGEITV